MSTRAESPASGAGFLAKVMVSVLVPVVGIGAALWWFVAHEQVDRAVQDQAMAMSRAVDLGIAPAFAADGSDAGVRLTGDLDDVVRGQFQERFGDLELIIVDSRGVVLWSGAGRDGLVALDDWHRSALSGDARGRSFGDAGEARYVVPVNVAGRPVAAADIVVASDPAVLSALDARTDLAWVFGLAAVAMVIALVPLCWMSLGDVGRRLRRTRALAMSDALTGLANRTQFHLRLDEALAGAERARTQVGLILLDLDGFKAINDTGGHAAGDRLLRRVAAGLGDVTRRNELACRLGGDEFALVVPRVADRDELRRLADRLHQRLDLPVSFADGRTLRVTASIGMAIYPEDAAGADDLVGVADTAMYRVKLSRKAQLPATIRAQSSS